MRIQGVDFGLSIGSSELRRKITESGWRIKQVKFDSGKDRYVCKAISDRGGELERSGKTERLALANMLLAVQARTSSVKLTRWNHSFTDRLQAIAEAYSKAPTYTAKAAEPFLALAQDSVRRADVLSRHLQIDIVNDPEPYKSAEKMVDDIRKRRRLSVSRAGAVGHPIWSEQEVVAYRICHDVLGYAAANSGWDWEGENEAFAHHVHLLSEPAQLALFTEALAFSAYNTYYHAFGPHKIATFPQFMNEAMHDENPHKGFPGVHPEESYPPIEMPSVKPIVSMVMSVDEPHYAAANPAWRDPNYGWRSSVEPMILPNGLTIKQTYGDPLGLEEGRANAALLARPWAQFKDPQMQSMMNENYQNGGPSFTDREFEYLKSQMPDEYQHLREVIANAFRAVLLSPKSSLFANALHYQMLSHSPYKVGPGETDPNVYDAALGTARKRYNMERYEEQFPGQGHLTPSHLAYEQFIKPFTRYVAEMKQIPLPEAGIIARDTINEWRQQEEERLQEGEADKPPEKQKYVLGSQLESAAAANVANILQALLAAHRKKQDFAVKEPEQPTWERRGPLMREYTGAVTNQGETIQDSSQGEDVPDLPGLPGPRRYPGWMYGQAVYMARLAPHIDDILKAALEDVHNHDASGHHFRSMVLQLNIKGIGAKVTSFAWLLLQPLTSQLATLDTHMMNVLGTTEDSPKPRDYYGWERAFRDRLNAMGYDEDSLPTGLGQWLIWDHERTGGGTHQDHSALAPDAPSPWHAVDWHAVDTSASESDPNWSKNQEWWAITEPYQQEQMDQWAQTYAPKTPQGVHPWQGMPKWGLPGADIDSLPPTTAKVAWMAPLSPPRTPYIVHPITGERIPGLPGQTIMQHATQTMGLSVPEVWKQLELAEVGKA